MGPNTYKIEIDKHLPDDIYSRLCYVFVQAAVEDDWRRLLPYCAQHICIVDYGEGTYCGQTSKVLGDFWKKTRSAYVYNDWWIHSCRFYARAVVLTQVRNRLARYIAFRVEQDLITHIIIFQCTMQKGVSLEFNPMAELPFA